MRNMNFFRMKGNILNFELHIFKYCRYNIDIALPDIATTLDIITTLTIKLLQYYYN